MWLFVVFLTTVATATSFDIGDAEYFEMPHLFHLDDWEECMAKEGIFCIGTFKFIEDGNNTLFSAIQNFSSTKYHYNHTLIHRGYCLPSTCAHIQGSTLRSQFEVCVNNLSTTRYGLATNLTDFKYCRTKDARPVDGWDLGFLGIVGVIVLMNVIGTGYDCFKSSEGKGIKLLMAWSVRANWKRLVADYSNGDPRLSALKPIHGMKVLALLMVILSHSWFMYHATYIYNPQFLEQQSYKFHSIVIQNGTVVVQVFIMTSSFLFAYNLLIQDKKQASLKMFPQALMHRIARITPLNLFIVGFSTSWWAHVSDGPIWRPLVEGEVAACRTKWWTHALYVNNMLKTDENCLIHTWSLAVDMQLYVVVTILTLLLARHRHAAVKMLLCMIVGAMAMDLAIAYHWRYKPMLVMMFPESLRTAFAEEPSFTGLYRAPWHCLPASLLGVLVAFVHYQQQVEDYRPAQSMVITVLYRISQSATQAWVMAGFWMKDLTDDFWLALYAILSRPVYAIFAAFCMYGAFNKIDSVWWKFHAWRGWEILGRMSLSIYLVHWLFTVSLFAVRTHASEVSYFYIFEHWVTTTVLSFCAALPLHLLIELPGMKFFQSLISA